MFSPDIILCGWLGSKRQLTNWLIVSKSSFATRGDRNCGRGGREEAAGPWEPPTKVSCLVRNSASKGLLTLFRASFFRSRRWWWSWLTSVGTEAVPAVPIELWDFLLRLTPTGVTRACNHDTNCGVYLAEEFLTQAVCGHVCPRVRLRLSFEWPLTEIAELQKRLLRSD